MNNLEMLSKLEQLNLPTYHENHLQVFVKREDLIHSAISGNKWRKLKYNILHAQDKCYKGILTFGGAYSNHLHATAFACREADLKLICIVRATDTKLDNPTMTDIQNWGGEIKLIDRETYKHRNDPEFLDAIAKEYPDYFIIPEGGNNSLAKKGIAEMAKEIDTHFDYIFISVGTGSSAIGLISNLQNSTGVIKAIAAVKDSSLKKDFDKNLEGIENWELNYDYTRGGFGKSDPELVGFINSYREQTGVLLDPIYNAKTFMAFHQMIEADLLPEHSKILLIHTGGLQGIRGHNLRYHHREDMIINI